MGTKIFKCYAAGLALLWMAASISAQTTAFTYQGRLTDGGAPPTGNYDIRIQLYDAPTGGNVICGAQGSPNVSVVNGSFTLQLDFGSEACFPFGSNRYLEVAVRPTGSPNPHTVLTPRQQILSTPYSMKSLKAQDANNATNAQLATNALSLGGFGASLYLRTNGDGSALTNLNAGSITSGTLGDARLSSNIARLDAANQMFTGNTVFSGNVGIGTSTPQSPLSVHTGLGYGLTHTDGTVTVGSYVNSMGGWLGTQSNHPLHFFTSDGSSRMTVATDGSVGIGTTTPSDGRLHVESTSIGIYAHTTSPFGFAGFFEGNLRVYQGGLTVDVGSGTYAADFLGDVQITGKTILNGRLELGVLPPGASSLCYNGSLEVGTCSSSLRYKKDFEPFEGGLSFINQLRPISFRWKSDDLPDIGFGAEDVAKIDPLFVTYNKKGQIEGVKYERLSVVFVNAFKEQQQQIEAHQRQNEQQQRLIEQQQRHIDALTRLVCQSKPRADICKRTK